MTYEPYIEAAAAAICNRLGGDEVWNLLAQVDRDKYREAARDAIAASGLDLYDPEDEY